ncbi:class I SAM-dependent methyltransferase [Cohnella hashimotonis]|uniref:SAM-dependent methyltransferase n=1 Tax=Cohnella hashimotonis TaxID=2826895 RepID=A0ABT6TP07_9BACL|nr:SAM-dependent methyltransferase [Cohnella hashimotonis]MDI4647562.1 SAM-dependent methyltransferase [Cohnella hashimotonis]
MSAETITEELNDLVRGAIEEGKLIQATVSQPRSKSEETRKIAVRPVLLKGELRYQFERFAGAKALHQNLAPGEAAAELLRLVERDYRQALLKTPDNDIQILVNKKGKAVILRSAPTAKAAETGGVLESTPSHNRTKTYVLPEGEPVPFLEALGVMTPEGRVIKAKYDKYRQINRFLEMVSDVISHLPTDRELTIVDFGCGKSYLTFALYHLLAIKERLPVRIIGLDLKADVIADCSKLADRLGWDRLRFAVGDIADYADTDRVDMVVTLHACDTATDAALLKAVGWQASVILSVPCCQHELMRQIEQPLLKPLLRHGILKERFSALVTDAVRAQLLEVSGYKVQMLEFIDLEHTPKNLLIRAVRSGSPVSPQTLRDYEKFRDFLSISPYMENNMELKAETK